MKVAILAGGHGTRITEEHKTPIRVSHPSLLILLSLLTNLRLQNPESIDEISNELKCKDDRLSKGG